jgi:5-methylcytosine-specific restriction endonuclease McrA
MSPHHPEQSDLASQDLQALFKLADKIGSKRYNRLTQQDFEAYRRFDYWRYVCGDYECGTTEESKAWVRENSEHRCPICRESFAQRNGKTIDHKLPRAQYPWLSMAFDNFWVICQICNREKAEKHWYGYERYIFEKYPDRYNDVRFARPRQLLQTLESQEDGSSN